MKCVSLSAVSVRELLKNDFTQSDVSFYTNNKHEYKTMWSQQGNEFWIKFVIVVKEILGESYDYECGTNDLDQPFIEFLDALLCVDYNSVSSYITQVGKSIAEFEALSAEKESHKQQYLQVRNKFQVVAAFVRILPVWQNSSSGSDFQWKIPEYWFSSEAGKHKLELFIKFKWSVVDIEEMFECDRNQVGWLSGGKSEPRKNENASSKESEFQRNEIQEIVTTDMKQKVVKGQLPPQGPKSSFKWLQTLKGVKNTTSNRREAGNLQMLRKSNSNTLRLWELVEVALPDMLGQRYYNNNIESLMSAGVRNLHFMGTAAMYSMWDHSFGLQYLKGIQEKHQELQQLNKDPCVASNEWKGTKMEKKVEKWRGKVDKLLSTIAGAKNLVVAPSDVDIANNPGELLFEAGVTIQLPWNCVLLHQWLIAALLEILMFEQNTVELRHWPLPIEVVNDAIRVVRMITELKQRIILGFAIMSKQIEMYPQVNRKHPALILDHVALPSAPILMSLTTPKFAYQVVNTIKDFAWTSVKHDPKTLFYMPVSAYTMDDFLENVYSNLCYNFMNWEYVNVPAPFPGALFEQVDIDEVITRMNTKQTITPESNASMKPLSREEKFLCRIVDKNREAVTNSERVSIALKIIQECVIEPGRLPGLKLDQVQAYLDTEEIRSRAGFITREYDESSISDMILVCSLMYIELNGMLIGSKKETSILARSVSLKLEVLRKEQVIRLSKLLGVKFGITPFAVDTDKSLCLPRIVCQFNSLKKLLKQFTDKQKQQNRGWLWQDQFPDSWKTPIRSAELSLASNSRSPINIIVDQFYDEIGIFLFNIARNSIEVYEKTGEVFKYKEFIQYLLPCYIISFVFTSKMPGKNARERQQISTNYQYFFNRLIQYLKKMYLKWLNGEPVDPVVNMKPFEDKEAPLPYMVLEIGAVAENYRNRAVALLRSHINATDEKDEHETGIPGGILIHLALQQWTNSLVSDLVLKDADQECIPYIITWSVREFEFFYLMFQVTDSLWKPPSLNVNLKNPKLQAIYATDVALHGLETIFQVMLGYKPYPKGGTELIEHLAVTSVKSEWGEDGKMYHHKVLQAVHENKAKFTPQEEKYYDKKIKMILKYYKTMKDHHTKIKTKVHFLYLFPDNPPEIKQAAELYVEGNFAELDKLIKVLPNLEEKKQTIESTTEKPSAQATIKPSKVKLTCKHCNKTSNRKNKYTFIACPMCVKQNYPEVNYYCSEECKEACWQEEHMAEHMERDLLELPLESCNI